MIAQKFQFPEKIKIKDIKLDKLIQLLNKTLKGEKINIEASSRLINYNNQSRAQSLLLPQQEEPIGYFLVTTDSQSNTKIHLYQVICQGKETLGGAIIGSNKKTNESLVNAITKYYK